MQKLEKKSGERWGSRLNKWAYIANWVFEVFSEDVRCVGAGSVGVVEEEGIKAKKTAKSGSLSTV